jgi:hypothetical protein
MPVIFPAIPETALRRKLSELNMFMPLITDRVKRTSKSSNAKIEVIEHFRNR